MKIEDVFVQQPVQWGANGDRFLWEEIEKVFTTIDREFTQENFGACLFGYIEGFVFRNGKKIKGEIFEIGMFPDDVPEGNQISIKWAQKLKSST